MRSSCDFQSFRAPTTSQVTCQQPDFTSFPIPSICSDLVQAIALVEVRSFDQRVPG